MVFQQTQAQLAADGKNINDPVELIKHKQEWVEKILQMHPALVTQYGKDAMHRAIDNRILAYLNFARAAGYQNPVT
ncbi:hypothetical protein IC235_11105 [Hymenobacter sp. BT664]|uniref:Uncharacterized protein n=1 Tax=Hymenobacter montanus TaxID=2771359 RepID=A0A927BE50_9BACT|nr:hypothetical protein [Hymenobacter montanus]MBD2768438.1 hypothetical protein [Hymenobacter montanus]